MQSINHLEFAFGGLYRVVAVVAVQLFRFLLKPFIKVVAFTIKAKQQNSVFQVFVTFLLPNRKLDNYMQIS